MCNNELIRLNSFVSSIPQLTTTEKLYHNFFFGPWRRADWWPASVNPGRGTGPITSSVNRLTEAVIITQPSQLVTTVQLVLVLVSIRTFDLTRIKR